jgi:hypothetical protein
MKKFGESSESNNMSVEKNIYSETVKKPRLKYSTKYTFDFRLKSFEKMAMVKA